MLVWGQPLWEWSAEMGMQHHPPTQACHRVGALHIPPPQLLLLSSYLQTLTGKPVGYKQGSVTLAKWLQLSEPRFAHLEKLAEAMCPTSTETFTQPLKMCLGTDQVPC